MGLLRRDRDDRRRQRERQREMLLEVAATLLAQRPWGELTLEELARRAGLSSGAGTMHFDTSEKLALHLLETELTRFYADLGERLDASTEILAAPAAARLLAETMGSRRLLRRLLALLPVLSEGGIDLMEVLAFRRRHLHAARVAAAVLARRVSGLDASRGAELLRRLETCFAGLEGLLPLAGDSGLTMGDETLQPLVVDPVDELEALARALLAQVEAERAGD